LLDGEDVEFIQNAITALPGSSFRPPGQGTRNALLVQLDGVEERLLLGDVMEAARKLQLIRSHVDGCGLTPDNNDWIIACSDQQEIRALLDVLIANLTT